MEFIGTPEAGKTTVIKALYPMLQEGYEVEIVRESAEVVPKEFQKGGIEAHLWMRNLTVNRLMQTRNSNKDIILVDRGIVDTYFWNYYFMQSGKMSKELYSAFTNYLKVLKLESQLAFFFFTAPEEAIKRRGGEGRVVTYEFVKKFNEQLEVFFQMYHGKKVKIDTTNLTKKQVTRITYEHFQKLL